MLFRHVSGTGRDSLIPILAGAHVLDESPIPGHEAHLLVHVDLQIFGDGAEQPGEVDPGTEVGDDAVAQRDSRKDGSAGDDAKAGDPLNPLMVWPPRSSVTFETVRLPDPVLRLSHSDYAIIPRWRPINATIHRAALLAWSWLASPSARFVVPEYERSLICDHVQNQSPW
jgi:hypothetical protein